jgi:chromosomal replication initiator protein
MPSAAASVDFDGLWKTSDTETVPNLEKGQRSMQTPAPDVPQASCEDWQSILSVLRPQLPSEQAFETWFRPLRPRLVTTDLIELEVPNLFFVDWIQEHYLSPLTAAVRAVMGNEPQLRFAISPDLDTPQTHTNGAHQTGYLSLEPATSSPSHPETWGAPRRTPVVSTLEPRLNPRFTFGNFVVGPSNDLTHATCLAVAENPGFNYNPLFIYGVTGLGKTHCMQAVGHAVLERRPEARVLYISAERFMNEMIFAIQRGQQLAFREKYRNVDLLLIDDIQFLANKDGTQEEFFYTFGALQEAHKQIVMTSDKAPREIKGLEERLVSRFTQGMVTDIKPPDLETRVAILKQRSAAYGYELSNEVALLIASRVRANVRHLEGVLVRLTALTELGGTKITVGLAEEVLRDYASSDAPALTLDRIAHVTADHFNVSVDLMRGKRRTNTIALPRQVAMYLARQRTSLSLSDVGAWFKRDHTTVLHACGKIDQMRESDARVGAALREILERLERP